MSDYTISVLIDGKDQLSSAAKSAEGALGGLGKIASGVLTVGLGAAVAGIGALGAVLGTSIKAAMDAENITAELNAVLKSTGGVSGMTADSVIAWRWLYLKSRASRMMQSSRASLRC